MKRFRTFIITKQHIYRAAIALTCLLYTSKCSICVVNETSAITADEGMYNLLKKRGLNVLKIDPCDIELYGMNGFIGGASGLLEDDLLAFNGDIRTHRNRDSITGFCKNAGVKIVCLNTGKLADIGTIIRIP